MEIMIVVSIIGILVALTIPNLLRARHNTNETAATACLRTISTACENYRAAQSPPSYPAGLNTLATSNPPYIDTFLAGATSPSSSRQGYYYTYTVLSSDQYTCLATPKTSGITGTRIFYVDETGVIRINNSAGDSVE